MLDAIRTNMTLLFVSAYIVLNLGFMMLRVPPTGQGVPIGELWLATMFATIFMDLRFARPFVNWTPIVPLFCWWLLGLFHLVAGIPAHGFWAFRDGGHWMESSYLWIGFVLASREDFYPRFERWLRLTFSVSVYYMLTYPFRATVSAYSPTIEAIAGWSTPFVGSYANSSGNVVTSLFSVLLARQKSRLQASWKLFVSVLALLVMIFLLQMRTGYLQLIVGIALLMYCRPQSLGRFAVVIAVGLVLAAILLNLNLDLTGRLGKQFTLDFFVNHIETIWGGGDYSVRSAADGVDLRVGWWNEIFERVNSSVGTALFGLGFGTSLTNWHGPAGGLVREPHNSLISVYGRMGVVGLALFIVIQARIYIVGLGLIATLKRLGKPRVLATVATTLCFMVVSIIFAQFEPGMELSYVCIPYYFFGGVILGLNRRIRLEIRQGPPALRRPSQVST